MSLGRLWVPRPALTGPVFPVVLVVRNDVAARYKFGDVHHPVESRVHHKTCYQAVRCAVAKRDEHDGDERRNGIPNIPPVDRDNLSHHEATDLHFRQTSSSYVREKTHKNQSRPRCPGRDGGENGTEEHGNEKADAASDGSQSGLSAFSDASSGLDEHRNRRSAKQGANRYADGIRAIRDSRPREVAGLWVHDAAKSGHAVKRGRTVEDIDIEKGEECECEVTRRFAQVPLQLVQDGFQRLEMDHLLEEVPSIIANPRAWEIRDGRVSSTQD